jgi:hypothetical protein
VGGFPDLSELALRSAKGFGALGYATKHPTYYLDFFRNQIIVLYIISCANIHAFLCRSALSHNNWCIRHLEVG